MRRRPTSTAAGGLVLALAVGLSACGSGGTSTPSPTIRPTTQASGATRPRTTLHPRTPPSSAQQKALQAAIHPSKLYFGVATPALPFSTAGITTFAKVVGKTPNLAGFYVGFPNDFYAPGLKAIAAGGQLPQVTWEPWNYLAPTTNPNSLTAIASGRFDTYIRRQALTVKSIGVPVAIRLAPEMNGNWFPWGQANSYKNSPAAYVAMWRHVHAVFAAAGATNAIWVWSPNVVSARPKVSIASLYPGNAYVDIVGVVGYLSATNKTFAGIFGSTFAALNTFAKTKPILLPETGVAPGSAAATQLRDLFHGILTTPRVIGFVWFDYDKGTGTQADWRLEDSASQASIFRRAVASPRFGGRPS